MKAAFALSTSIILVTSMAYAFVLNIPEGIKTDVTLGIFDVKGILEAPDGHVTFLFWADERSDMLGCKPLYDACAHPSEAFYTLGDQLVNEDGCPRPDAFKPDDYIVFFGGPSVQPAVMYYQKTNQTRVSILEANSTHVALTTIREGIVHTDFLDALEFDINHDIFVIEFFVDNFGRKVLMCYGYGSQGTFAAAVYMVETMLPKIEAYVESFYVFRWVDTNNDCVPDADEVSEKKQEYVSIQAFLHWNADPQVVAWFANTCHSHGLKVTWYVNPSNNGNVASLLKDCMSVGDDVQMSFGNVFFNKLSPEERLRLVNEQLSNFKKEFCTYPSLVEAYYIDAFTLNYIASRFSFVTGAVGYVNHEQSCDGLKTAGAYYMPYYPSKFNTIVPGEGEDKIPIVMLPLAHRDLLNNVLQNDVRFNLSPQDGLFVVDEWRGYFERLFDAYLNGWDQFGLALYAVDLTFDPLPKEVIDEDLAFIQKQVELKKCSNALDREFVQWFKETFADSPCYRWMYNDPKDGAFSSVWHFTPKGRTGEITDHFTEIQRFPRSIEEGCYYERVDQYDNSLIEPKVDARFLRFKTELVQSSSYQTPYMKGDGVLAYDFWYFPIVDITADVTGTYEIVWSYRNILDGNPGGFSGAIGNSVDLVAWQSKEFELSDGRDLSTSGRDPHRGNSIAYGYPDSILDGEWHLFESIVSVTIISPSGATSSCQGFLREYFLSPLPTAG